MILNNDLNIGEVEEGSYKEFVIKLDGSKKIESIRPLCGSCTTVKGYSDNDILLSFRADYIPYHIESDKWDLVKKVEVYYEDYTMEVIYFNVTIKRKN